jgi:hypothetical protein
VRESGHISNHLIPRSLAAVAGALRDKSELAGSSTSIKSSLLGALTTAVFSKDKGQDKDPVVVFIHSDQAVGGDNLPWEVGIVLCEGGKNAASAGNKFGFERLVSTWNTGGRNRASDGAYDEQEIIATLKQELQNVNFHMILC